MTNNKPTDELLRQRAELLRSQYTGSFETMHYVYDAGVIDELLAARAQIQEYRKVAGEPALYASEETLLYAKNGELHLRCLSEPMGDAVIPLYRHPQPAPAVEAVPVVPDEQGKPHPVMAVKGELCFIDHFERLIDERDDDIDIGQLGSYNCEALMLAALDAFRASMQQPESNRDELGGECWCHTCRPVTIADMRFVVCPECGNKRCPHANDHRYACTGSNEPGQEGSAYPAAPQQEGDGD